jgi:hypothetical protein
VGDSENLFLVAWDKRQTKGQMQRKICKMLRIQKVRRGRRKGMGEGERGRRV